jgi:hypothetical protein
MKGKKMFKEMLLESENMKVYVKGNINDSSLCKELSDKDSKKLWKVINNHPESSDKLLDFIESGDTDIRYGETLIIEYQNKIFTLYPANGFLRFGAGGSRFSNCEEVKKISISSFIKDFKKAKIYY